MSIGQHTVLALLKGYRLLVSPALKVLLGPGSGCRFEPTCSVYAAHAVESHGVLRGSSMALKRLCKCHPWGPAGLDPVPVASNAKARVIHSHRGCCCSRPPNS